MATGSYRKIFVDSRSMVPGGTHGNFTVYLQDDVATTKTSSVFVSSCGFSNTWETVSQNINDRLYVLADNHGAIIIQAGVNDRLYGMKGDPQHPEKFWFPVPAGAYTGATLAPILTDLLHQYTDGVGRPTAAVQYVDGVLSFTDGQAQFLFPSSAELQDRTWKANIWDHAATLTQSAYDPDATMDLNKTLHFMVGSPWRTPFVTGNLEIQTGAIISLPVSQYTGASLAPVLQTAVRTLLGNVNVTE